MSSARWTSVLSAEQAGAVRRLAAAATVADGVGPLNEAALLALAHPGRHLLANGADGALHGYAQLDADSVAQLVVAPDVRRHGHGTALLAAADAAGARHAWAFGDLPAAQALAARHRASADRVLLIMGRSLHEPLPATPVPAGFTVRTFRPGADDADWLAVNARAFAHHPEQGRLTSTDLAERRAAEWFDPAGFLVAERAPGHGQQAGAGEPPGALAGYHWTKSHGRDAAGALVGEVYVLGVDPAQGGRGLGKALLVAGLDRLARTGHDRVVLYVEASERRVVALYEWCGFAEISRDVMYAWT